MANRDGDEAVIDRIGEAVWAPPAAAPSIVPSIDDRPAGLRARPDTRPGELSRCPEIDCVRALLPPVILSLAEQRAAEAGVGADRVLVTWGVISEKTYVAALSAALGVPIEPLNGRSRSQCPLSDDQLVTAATTGMLPIAGGDGVRIAVAPCMVDSRRLAELARSGTDLAQSIRLTDTASLQDFVTRHASVGIERQAVDQLRTEHPRLSAGAGHPRLVVLALCIAAAAFAGLSAPGATMLTIEITLGFVFLAWTGLRLLGLLTAPFLYRRRHFVSDARLPIYTIIVALYREAEGVSDLVAALRGLNYPHEKLDIKFAVEPDDHATRDALANLRLGPPFEIIVSPENGPRTKPKALNTALQLARGSFVAVYDAEDRPEPDQLRLALEAFIAGDRQLACVQARLTIDNSSDGWLTRVFTAEYAGLFDVFLPGLAAWRLPLPLGGSSNHFRTDVLREIGAWDPYNVTEDADLGMRLARFGYRSAVIPSTTYEEAPAHIVPWLRQRTRWFKGWIQTWLVHMRAPLRLARELRWPGFAAFQLVVGGSVLAALIHAVFLLQLAINIAVAPHDDTTAHLFLGFYVAMLVSGYAISALLSVVGLARRNLLHCAWALLLMPVYWLLLSIAAWRALYQLIRDPYRWEKTEHGLARTSRLAKRNQR